MKRLLSVLLAAVMLFSFAACTGGTGGGSGSEAGDREFTTGYDKTKYNEPGTFPIFKEKQTITVMLADQSYVEDWDTNKQTLALEKNLNADIVFNVMSAGEYSTKINLMAAAGGEEFSDVILGGFADGMVMNLADTGVVVPITEYAYNKDVGYYMHKALDRNGWDYYPQITMPDGEIYYLPRIGNSILSNNSKMWFYKPWFDAAGVDISAIHTTEDFKEALLKVVKSDPNGNGKADEVGISSYASSKKWMHYLMNAFVYADGDKNYMYVKDGNVNFAFLKDEWKEGLKYIKELYDLGLIDPLAFSQDSAGFKSMINYDETLIAAWAMTDNTRIAQDDPRRIEYVAVPPLNSSWNGGKPLSIHTAPSASCGMMISLNAENPEIPFRFGDYMVSEEMSVYSRYGEKGVDWFEPEEGDVSLYDYLGYKPYLREYLPWATVQNAHWYGSGPYIRHKEITAGAVWDGTQNLKNGTEAQIMYSDSNPEEEITKLIYTEEENEIISAYLANIKTYVEETMVKFILGELDIDAEWGNFNSELQKMCVDDVLECAQAAYDRMK